MKGVLNNIHFVIIFYAFFQWYTIYAENSETINDVKSSIPNIKSQINKKKREQKDLKNYYTDIENAKQKIELVALEVEKVQKQLPNTISDTENLSLIKNIAESINLKNIYLAPGVEENKGFYFSKRYAFTATGTFLQFLILTERISHSNRLLNIRKIKLEKAQKKQRGRFQLISGEIQIEGYRYNQDYKEDRGINKIEQEFKKKAKKKKPRKKRRGKRRGRKK